MYTHLRDDWSGITNARGDVSLNLEDTFAYVSYSNTDADFGAVSLYTISETLATLVHCRGLCKETR